MKGQWLATGTRSPGSESRRNSAGLCIGINFHLADSKEQAVKEATPFYEEHAKMFAPSDSSVGSTTRSSRPWRSVPLGPGRLPHH